MVQTHPRANVGKRRFQSSVGFQCTVRQDVAIPGDARVRDKELVKIEKYQLLREEIRKLWKLKKVTVVPVVIGALGAVSDKFDKHIEKLGTTIRLEVIQKTALLGTARLLTNVLSVMPCELIHKLNNVGLSDSMNVIRKCQKWVIAQNCEIVKAFHSRK